METGDLGRSLHPDRAEAPGHQGKTRPRGSGPLLTRHRRCLLETPSQGLWQRLLHGPLLCPVPRAEGCRLHHDLRQRGRLSRVLRLQREPLHRPARLASGGKRPQQPGAGHHPRHREGFQALRRRPPALQHRRQGRSLAPHPPRDGYGAPVGLDQNHRQRRALRRRLPESLCQRPSRTEGGSPGIHPRMGGKRDGHPGRNHCQRGPRTGGTQTERDHLRRAFQRLVRRRCPAEPGDCPGQRAPGELGTSRRDLFPCRRQGTRVSGPARIPRAP